MLSVVNRIISYSRDIKGVKTGLIEGYLCLYSPVLRPFTLLFHLYIHTHNSIFWIIMWKRLQELEEKFLSSLHSVRQ